MKGAIATGRKSGDIGLRLTVMGLLLAIILISVDNGRALAGTNPVLEPGFETSDHWTLTSTTDNYTGRRTTSWETEGSRSYEIRYQAASGEMEAGSAELYQENIDLTDADAIVFDTQLYGWSQTVGTVVASVYIDDTEMWRQDLPLSTTVYLNETFDVSGYSGPHTLSFHLDNDTPQSTITGGRFRIDNIRANYASEAICFTAQNYEDTVDWFIFPAGDPETMVANPSNNQSETQHFGDAGEAQPVATLVNYGSAAYIMSFEISEFEFGIVESEYYLINDKGAACLDADAICNLVEFDTLIATDITLAPGSENAKDLYLKILLSDIAGRSGFSEISILGEKE